MKTIRVPFAGLVAACLLAAFAPVGAKAAPSVEGAFDPSYGYGGESYDVTFPGGSLPFEEAMAVMADGRVVVADYDKSGAAGAVRYRANGILDSSYGVNGYTSGVASGTGIGGRGSIAVDSTGRVLLGGYLPVGSGYEAAIFRYTASGSPDLGFGVQGRAAIPLSSGQDSYATAIYVLPSGKILVGGYSGSAMFLTRLTAGGSVDSTFGNGGYASTIVNSNATTVSDIAVHSDGRIVTVGDESANGYSGFAVTSWTAAGQPDSSFSGGAIADAFLDLSSSVHNHAYAVALQPDGKILVGGTISWADPDMAVVRYEEDGSRDAQFGFSGTGVWNANLSSTSESVQALALQRDGKPVLFGDADVGGDQHYNHVAARLTTAGIADPAFGTSGTPGFDILDFDNLYDHSYAGRVLRDGRIVGAGSSYVHPSMYKLVGDLVPPSSPAAHALPRFVLAASVGLTWAPASDDNTGVHTYNVLTQSSRYDASSPGPAGTYKTGLTSRKASVARKPGFTRCFVVEARDYAGNLGAPGNEVCTAFPADDRTLSAKGSWTAGKNRADYLGTFRRSTSAGAALSLKVAFRHLALVAMTCPTCGTVKIYLGKTLLAKKSLHARTTHNRVVIPIVAAGNVRSGALRIVQASGGKQVVIDGLAVSRV